MGDKYGIFDDIVFGGRNGSEDKNIGQPFFSNFRYRWSGRGMVRRISWKRLERNPVVLWNRCDDTDRQQAYKRWDRRR